MKEISFDNDNEGDGDYMAPKRNPDGKMVCCAGFELLKQDKDTYRCSAGGHVYKFSEGDVRLNTFGVPEFDVDKYEEEVESENV